MRLIGTSTIPRHEKLVKNMVAGATGFSLALWVVDARESVMPQSREHLHILDLLGVRSLIPVITKADLATEDQIAATRRDVEALLRDAEIRAEPLHLVDSASGRGIAGLKQAIFTCCRDGDDAEDRGLPYLPVDRVFSVRGIGTVVTGTLVRGRLAEGDHVAFAGQPGSWRVRSLHNHSAPVAEIGAGHRVGVNLAGLGADATRRGAVLVAPWHPYAGRFLNVRLRWVEGAPREWKHGVRLLFHAGSTEVECRLWGVEPEGSAAWAQVELRSELPFFPGQRFILRNTNPLTTVGGGEVLDLAPDRPRRLSPAERTAYALRERGGAWLAAYLEGAREPVLDLAALARRWMVPEGRLRRDAEASPELRTDSAGARVWRTEWEAELLARLRAFVERHPRAEQSVPYGRLGRELRVNAAHLPPLLVSLLERDAPAAAFLRDHFRLERAGLVLYPGVVPWTAEESALAVRLLARLAEDGLRPSRIREYQEMLADGRGLLDPVLVKLQGDGRVVRIDEKFVLHADAARELRRAVADGSTDGARASEWGRALGLSRKYSIPFLEYLNREGVLRREGDLHFRT